MKAPHEYRITSSSAFENRIAILLNNSIVNLVTLEGGGVSEQLIKLDESASLIHLHGDNLYLSDGNIITE